MVGYVEEFASFLIPDHERQQAHPVEEDEVFARQNRPSQRRILNEAAAMGGLSSGPVRTFMKKESYAKVTDPRNISMIPGQNKLKYASYMYAFSEILKRTAWYAFGLTPLAIAERVAALCAVASSACLTDLSRCDGRISNLLRYLEKVIMMRAFHPAYHADLSETMSTQFGQTAYTATGYQFETEFSRLSGSSETADFNSCASAFIAYVTLRRSGLSPAEAWAALGLYGGDDGLTTDVSPTIYTESAKSVGQVLECEVIKRGERGISFLARNYSPHVWDGAPDSMCDLKRQLIKLHLSGRLASGVTPLAKLREKLRGFSLTDLNTPVIGQYARAVETRYGKADPLDSSITSYWAKYGSSVQFPNQDLDGWMVDEASHNFPTFDFNRFNAYVIDVTLGAADPLSPPLCSEVKAPVVPPADVVVDGDIVLAAKAAATPLPEDKEEKEDEPQDVSGPKQPSMPAPKKNCEFYLAGKCTFGKKCKMLHVGNVPQAKAECGKFKKTGVCDYGSKCKFVHTAKL
jgi:hypothetical protein